MLRCHLQRFFGSYNEKYCVKGTKKRVSGFQKIFVACSIKKCCCNTAAKSNSFDVTAVLEQQKCVSANILVWFQRGPLSETQFLKQN